jgi:diacylglycerol kinase family enzyme
MITVSNGRFLGGAFRIAPNASVLDGRLDVCFFQDGGIIRRMRMFAAAFSGTHTRIPGVVSDAVSRIELSFADKPAMELDGELRRAAARVVDLRCAPYALRVIAAPDALL